MLDTLRQWLEVALIIAVLVIFFGLVARSNVRAARIFGWFSIAWALAATIIEGYGWYDKGDWIVIPAKQIWHQLDRSSFNAVEGAIERYFSQSLAVGVDWVLNWPAWAVLSLLGMFFLVYDHIQLQRQHKGAPPAPLWKRLYKWVRDVVNRDEEQADA